MGRGMWGGPGGRYCRNRARQAFNNEWRKSHPKNEPPDNQEMPPVCIIVIFLLIFLLILFSK